MSLDLEMSQQEQSEFTVSAQDTIQQLQLEVKRLSERSEVNHTEGDQQLRVSLCVRVLLCVVVYFCVFLDV